MPTLTICIGLPASGKSTWAREQCHRDGNVVRVNRDDLRAMMRDAKWSGKFEGVVRKAEREHVRTALNAGWSVIVDDTNLNATTLQSWIDLAKEVGAVPKKQYFSTPLSTCIERDQQRAASVGRPVIERMSAQARLTPFLKPIAVFDLDGTLSDPTHRLQHVKQEPKDWKSFLSLCGDDGVRAEIAMKAEVHKANGDAVVIVSGRSAEYWPQTQAWLERYHIVFDHIFMRQSHDRRPDTETKKEILDMLPKAQIVAVYDDRPSVIRMWRENGLNVIDVGNGKEF